MTDFIVGALLGLFIALPFRIAFETRTFVVWSSRRGWVLKWEYDQDKGVGG